MDKRKLSYKKYKEIKEILLSKECLCAVILGAIIGLSLGTYYWKSCQPKLLTPLVKPEAVKVVQIVEAAEPKYVTPTKTPGRRYQKYSQMLEYDNIISELQMLYIKWEDAADLQSRENGFNPKAINPTSGACGLSQALPCKKLPCTLGDIKCDLKWQKDYISQRYGTVTNALKFQITNNWY